MHKIMEYVCKEMEDLEKKIEKNGGLTSSETQYLDTLAHTKKNLLKAEDMSEDEGSYRGSYGAGSYRRYMSFDEPMYADRERTETSRYSTRRRDSMGRYSREDGYSRAESDDIIEELRGLMGDLPTGKQRELHEIIKRIESR